MIIFIFTSIFPFIICYLKCLIVLNLTFDFHHLYLNKNHQPQLFNHQVTFIENYLEFYWENFRYKKLNNLINKFLYFLSKILLSNYYWKLIKFIQDNINVQISKKSSHIQLTQLILNTFKAQSYYKLHTDQIKTKTINYIQYKQSYHQQ